MRANEILFWGNEILFWGNEKVLRGNKMYFVGTKSVYVLLSPLPGSVKMPTVVGILTFMSMNSSI